MPKRPTQQRRSTRREQLKQHELALKKRRAYRAAHRNKINTAHLKWEHDNPKKVARYRKKKNARRQRLRREARRLARQTTE